jgi:CubicO group peptidase (beta-lactamase class C family)
VTDYLPGLKGTGYDGAPIAALLEMSSGAAFTETDAVNFWLDTAIRHDTPASHWALRARSIAPPFARFNYSGLDSAVLGELIEAVTRKPLAVYLSERLWRPLGMEDDATWGLDGGGAELPYCCLNARLRDLARLGQFLLDGGGNILPPDFIAASTKSHHDGLVPGHMAPGYPLGYGYQWWLMPKDGAFTGHGAYGQFLYVNPGEHLVIVLTSAWPGYWDYGLEAQAYGLFDAFAKALK